MASYSTPRIFTHKAGGVIAAFTFVKFGADLKHVVPCGANDRPMGIAMGPAVNIDDPVEVAYPGGGGKLILAGTTALGARLYADAAAKGKVVDGASKFYGAEAYGSGVANDVIEVMVTTATESVATD